MAYKYKLKEMSKTASPEEAAKELERKEGEPFAVGQVTYSADGTTKSTIRDIDPTTGAVSWKVEQLPGFEKLYDEVDEFVDIAKRVYQKTKDDAKFREFYEQARKIRNAIRTHLRNEYPDEYKRFQSRVDEGEVDEMSTSGGAGAYLTPYAFRKKGQKPNIKAYKELGYKEVEEEYIVTGKKGKGEAQYGEPYGTRKEAEAAMEKILKSIKDAGEKPDAKFGVRKGPLEENNNPGATLGPGPKAGPTGVKDNYYVKAFKYKLVPDKIKGSGIEVKKLF